VMQSAGRQFAAGHVRRDASDAIAQLQMDIAPAYPAAAKVKSWLRTVRLNRGTSIEMTEAFELTETVGETTLNFLTPLDADTGKPGQVTLRTAAQNSQRPVTMRLEYDATKLAPRLERIELQDVRLAKSWGTHLNRLVFRAKSPAQKDNWTFIMKLD
jgi:hypothetical protein